MPNSKEKSPDTVQSVERAVSILEILARRGEAGVTEVAEELGVHKSTASRLLSVLDRRGLASQMEERGRYRLGYRILLLANATVGHLDLSRIAQPECEALAAEVGETVNIAVLEEGASINVAQARGPASIHTHNWIGQRTPLHATSSGKVLLAYLDETECARLLGPEMTRFTDQTVTDPIELSQQLAEIRELGWGHTAEELEVGLNAVAAPIMGYNGRVVASISLSGPSYRLAAESMRGVAPLVVRSGERISAQLGHSS